MYIRDMNFALRYALESRTRMMGAMRLSIKEGVANVKYSNRVNIRGIKIACFCAIANPINFYNILILICYNVLCNNNSSLIIINKN